MSTEPCFIAAERLLSHWLYRSASRACFHRKWSTATSSTTAYVAGQEFVIGHQMATDGSSVGVSGL